MGLKHNSHTPRVLPESAKPFLKSLTPNFQADKMEQRQTETSLESGHVISILPLGSFFSHSESFHMDGTTLQARVPGAPRVQAWSAFAS